MRTIKLDDYDLLLIGFAKEIRDYLSAKGAKREEAEDVVQDVFVKMLESDFVIPKEKLRAWMYRVSIRKYIDRYRRDKHYLELLQGEFWSQGKALFSDKDEYDFLKEAFIRLAPAEQILLDLYYFQGFSVKEIASILGHTPSKVKVDLFRIRKKLGQLLEKKGYQNGNL